MSASPYLHSCNELGVCQDRLHRCTDCQDAESSVRVIRMINSRRVHTIDEPVSFCPHRPVEDDTDPKVRRWFWRLYLGGFAALVFGLLVVKLG